jgi:hypothetical protein
MVAIRLMFRLSERRYVLKRKNRRRRGEGRSGN